MTMRSNIGLSLLVSITVMLLCLDVFKRGDDGLVFSSVFSMLV